jgi:hypothetical protein
MRRVGGDGTDDVGDNGEVGDRGSVGQLRVKRRMEKGRKMRMRRVGQSGGQMRVELEETGHMRIRPVEK